MKKAALVTGGAKRIGREIALFLAKEGFDIALTYNDSSADCEKTSDDIRKLDSKCEIFKTDLSIKEDLIKLMPCVFNKFPDLQILINNASIFKPGQIKETSMDLFDKHLSTNLRAPFFLSKEFAQQAQSGQIINLLDTRITSKRTTYSAYSLSKMGLAEFTKMSAIEFAPKIRVNAIAPGLILPPEDKTHEYLVNLAKNIPAKQHGDVNNIIQTVNFLLKNEFITGEIIFCDGGEHLTR